MFNKKLKQTISALLIENDHLKTKLTELEEKYGEVAKILGKYHTRLTNMNLPDEAIKAYL
jgi:hypothetical protein